MFTGYVDNMRFWCYKVLPLVYDDSLSYYEVLCKCVAKLNEIAQSVNTLGDFTNTIQQQLNQLSDKHEQDVAKLQAQIDLAFETTGYNAVITAPKSGEIIGQYPAYINTAVSNNFRCCLYLPSGQQVDGADTYIMIIGDELTYLEVVNGGVNIPGGFVTSFVEKFNNLKVVGYQQLDDGMSYDLCGEQYDADVQYMLNVRITNNELVPTLTHIFANNPGNQVVVATKIGDNYLMRCVNETNQNVWFYGGLQDNHIVNINCPVFDSMSVETINGVTCFLAQLENDNGYYVCYIPDIDNFDIDTFVFNFHRVEFDMDVSPYCKISKIGQIYNGLLTGWWINPQYNVCGCPYVMSLSDPHVDKTEIATAKTIKIMYNTVTHPNNNTFLTVTDAASNYEYYNAVSTINFPSTLSDQQAGTYSRIKHIIPQSSYYDVDISGIAFGTLYNYTRAHGQRLDCAPLVNYNSFTLQSSSKAPVNITNFGYFVVASNVNFSNSFKITNYGKFVNNKIGLPLSYTTFNPGHMVQMLTPPTSTGASWNTTLSFLSQSDNPKYGSIKFIDGTSNMVDYVQIPLFTTPIGNLTINSAKGVPCSISIRRLSSPSNQLYFEVTVNKDGSKITGVIFYSL